MTAKENLCDTLQERLKMLRLPSFQQGFEGVARAAHRDGWSYGQFLLGLVDLELDDRRNRRVSRLLQDSALPMDKQLSAFDQTRLPLKLKRQLSALCQGEFLDHHENILVFGLPGTGKTHYLCAIGHELVQRGHSILFTSGFALVERLLKAKQNLTLEKHLRMLDRYEGAIIDDIGYIQHSREEVEVLFTFLAERYERRSVMISSNLVFSQWEQIFKNPTTAVAAIDRPVHHATILELLGPSYREDQAKKRNQTGDKSGAEMQG